MQRKSSLVDERGQDLDLTGVREESEQFTCCKTEKKAEYIHRWRVTGRFDGETVK